MYLLNLRSQAERGRLILWERGTFLRYVKKTRCRGDVWLSTSPQKKSKAEWLRAKFDIQFADKDDVICIPHGDGHGPGLIIIDLTPGGDERLVVYVLYESIINNVKPSCALVSFGKISFVYDVCYQVFLPTDAIFLLF